MNKKIPEPRGSAVDPTEARVSCKHLVQKGLAGVCSIMAVFSLAIIGFGMQTSSSTFPTPAVTQTQNDTLNNAVVAGIINLNDVDAQWVGLEMKGDENNPVFKVGNSIGNDIANFTQSVAVVVTGNENKFLEVGISAINKLTTGDVFATNSQSFADGLGGGRTMKIPNSALTTGGGGGGHGGGGLGSMLVSDENAMNRTAIA
jgi:hypothetical protein